MDRKEIQEQRIKSYFIEATKNILKGEGMKAISVRNIAQQAGYSYATLYNYFKDVKTLIFICVEDFQTECLEFIQERTEGKAAGKEKLEATIHAYIGYFVEYPSVFELFYLEKMAQANINQDTTNLIVNFLGNVCSEDWACCITQGVVTEQEAVLKQELLDQCVTGLLLFYLNRKYPETYPDFIQKTKNIIEKVLF